MLPYFQGVQAAPAQRGGRYVAGVYGSRNVCTRVSTEAGARFSFVAGMSYGFSGNLGFPMPSNWSFNQVKEFSFSASGDTFDLDNDVYRGTGDRGATSAGGTILILAPARFPAGLRGGLFPAQEATVHDILTDCDGLVRRGGDRRVRPQEGVFALAGQLRRGIRVPDIFSPSH